MVADPAVLVAEPAGLVAEPAVLVAEPAVLVAEPAGFVAEPVDATTEGTNGGACAAAVCAAGAEVEMSIFGAEPAKASASFAKSAGNAGAE